MVERRPDTFVGEKSADRNGRGASPSDAAGMKAPYERSEARRLPDETTTAGGCAVEHTFGHRPGRLRRHRFAFSALAGDRSSQGFGRDPIFAQRLATFTKR